MQAAYLEIGLAFFRLLETNHAAKNFKNNIFTIISMPIFKKISSDVPTTEFLTLFLVLTYK